MSQDAALLSSDCLLHTFYVCIQFLLACPSLELHLIGDISNDLPVDIRLHDFRLRYRLDLTCLTQLIRTVHAARHAAYHFSNWSLKRGTNSIEEFTYHTFGSDVDVAEIQDMVRDGQRLGQIEYQCGSAYASFIVALDWHRFQATPDSQLLQLTNDLLSAPAVQGLLGLLMPQWPADSFGRYHEQVVQFRWMTLHQRSCFMQWLSTGCRGCILFTMPQDSDSSSCVGCRRGGFACRSALEPCIAQPQPRPEFLTCAVELLHRGHAKCDSLLAHFGLDGNQQKPQIRGGEPQHSDRALSILCGTAFSREVQTLDMILVIDQKLEGLCNRITVGACERCRQRKVKCLRGPTCLRSFERYRRTPTYGGPLRTLLPVKEEGGEQGNHDTEAASREAPCIDVAQHCVRAVMNPV